MSYLVLARKWRPLKFDEVVGQKHVIVTLENAIKSNRLANAYLFSGPRGVGKTTVARILAKAINCEQGPTVTPCNKCASCNEITESRSLDVFEIDGASNRGIDEVRNLRENLRYAPHKGKHKIYIIDEVHMLTTEAFNALLKTLEEPPPNVLFIFATTEPHKVPATILSRCQRFSFKRIPLSEIIQQLKTICQAEHIEIDEESLHLIAKKADGSMRDGQSILDQAVSFCGAKIQVQQVAELLGVIEQELFFELSDLIKRKDVKGGLALAERIFYEGYDVNEFLIGAAEHFRNLLVIKSSAPETVGKGAEVLEAELSTRLEVTESYVQRYLAEAPAFKEEDLLRLIKIASDTEYSIKRSPNPRLKLEFGILKMIKLDTSLQLGELLEKIEGLKRKFNGSVTTLQKNKAPEEISHFSQPKLVSDSQKPHETGVKVLSDNKMEAEKEKKENILPAGDQDAISLERLKENWIKIVDEIKKKKIAIGSFINEGVPTSLQNGTLEITFGKDNGFHINSINKNKRFIEEVIAQLVGVNLRIKCVKGDHESPNGAARTGKNLRPSESPPRSAEERLAEVMAQVPILKTIIEVFEGELVS